MAFLQHHSLQDTSRASRTRSAANVVEERKEYAKAMNPETIIDPFETFMERYAPFNPQDPQFIENVREKLKQDKLINDKGICPVLQPNGLSEVARYDPLTRLCESIGKLQYNNRSAVFTFEQQPARTTTSEILGSSHKIDALFRPIHTTVPRPRRNNERVPTADVAVNCEWKVSNKDLADNRQKIVSGAVHVLNNDLRRNHAYSITIEDSEMSLWYWSRSHSVKSDPIDISKDTDQVIRALSCFIFADMFEMGYDDKIIRFYDPQKAESCYVIWLEELKMHFRSISVIDKLLTVCASGRHTVVLKVVQVQSFDNIVPIVNAPHMVLKIAWAEKHRPTDRQIQEDIFGTLDRIRQDRTLSALELDETAWKDLSEPLMNYHRYFMTIKACETGAETREVPTSKARRTKHIFDPKPVRTIPPAESISRSQSEAFETKAKVLVINRPFAVKHRVFTLFAEVCKDLRGLDTMVTVLETMQQCLIGLQLMHIAGWIHRDISCGNLLHYEGRGILSDLEYAKKIWPLQQDGSDDPQSQDAHLVPALGPDPKTASGTPAFMAVEIIQGFRLALDDIDDFSQTQMEATPVKHWYHHDLESFFWLLFWFLARRADSETAVRLRNGVGDSKVTAFVHKRVSVSVASASPLDSSSILLIRYINKLLLQDCRLHNQDFVPWFHREVNPTTGKLRVNGQIADVIRRRPQYAEMNKTLEALKAPVQKVEKSRLDQFVDLPMIQPGKSVRKKRSSSLEDDRNPPKNRVMSDGVDANRKLK